MRKNIEAAIINKLTLQERFISWLLRFLQLFNNWVHSGINPADLFTSNTPT